MAPLFMERGIYYFFLQFIKTFHCDYTLIKLGITKSSE